MDRKFLTKRINTIDLENFEKYPYSEGQTYFAEDADMLFRDVAGQRIGEIKINSVLDDLKIGERLFLETDKILGKLMLVQEKGGGNKHSYTLYYINPITKNPDVVFSVGEEGQLTNSEVRTLITNAVAGMKEEITISVDRRMGSYEERIDKMKLSSKEDPDGMTIEMPGSSVKIYNASKGWGGLVSTGDQEFSGIKAFDKVISNFEGDLVGDVAGDVVGHLQGTVAGDVTGDLTGNVTGDLTGNVTGDVSGNLEGNASTASKLLAARTIASTAFDGSKNIDIIHSNLTGKDTTTTSEFYHVGLAAATAAESLALGNIGTTGGKTTILGDLDVKGGTTSINTTELEIEDNIIKINKNQAGAPSDLLVSGLEVERGTLDNFLFAFVEASKDFRVGKAGNMQAVATRVDNPMENSLMYWNGASGEHRLHSTGVVWDENKLKGDVHGDLSGTFTGEIKDSTVTGLRISENVNIGSDGILGRDPLGNETFSLHPDGSLSLRELTLDDVDFADQDLTKNSDVIFSSVSGLINGRLGNVEVGEIAISDNLVINESGIFAEDSQGNETFSLFANTGHLSMRDIIIGDVNFTDQELKKSSNVKFGAIEYDRIVSNGVRQDALWDTAYAERGSQIAGNKISWANGKLNLDIISHADVDFTDQFLKKSSNVSFGTTTSRRFISTETFAAPMTIASTALVENLNAEYLAGKGYSHYINQDLLRVGGSEFATNKFQISNSVNGNSIRLGAYSEPDSFGETNPVGISIETSLGGDLVLNSGSGDTKLPGLAFQADTGETRRMAITGPTGVLRNMKFSSITELGKISQGSWEAGIIEVSYGGTGRQSFAEKSVLVGNGEGGINSAAGMKWDAASGNLGVGLTNSAAERIHVDGSIKASEKLILGSFTIDNTGSEFIDIYFAE